MPSWRVWDACRTWACRVSTCTRSWLARDGASDRGGRERTIRAVHDAAGAEATLPVPAPKGSLPRSISRGDARDRPARERPRPARPADEIARSRAENSFVGRSKSPGVRRGGDHRRSHPQSRTPRWTLPGPLGSPPALHPVRVRVSRVRNGARCPDLPLRRANLGLHATAHINQRTQ